MNRGVKFMQFQQCNCIAYTSSLKAEGIYGPAAPCFSLQCFCWWHQNSRGTQTNQSRLPKHDDSSVRHTAQDPPDHLAGEKHAVLPLECFSSVLWNWQAAGTSITVQKQQTLATSRIQNAAFDICASQTNKALTATVLSQVGHHTL